MKIMKNLAKPIMSAVARANLFTMIRLSARPQGAKSTNYILILIGNLVECIINSENQKVNIKISPKKPLII